MLSCRSIVSSHGHGHGKSALFMSAIFLHSFHLAGGRDVFEPRRLNPTLLKMELPFQDVRFEQPSFHNPSSWLVVQLIGFFFMKGVC